MFIDKVVSLYEDLDYKQETTGKEHVRLFNRIEGAEIVYELVWILDQPQTPSDYGQFSLQLQNITKRPGSKRFRLVSEKAEYLDSPFLFSSETGKHTWISLIRELFHTDRFCDKVAMDYKNYRSMLSQQMQALSGINDCEYSYVDQFVKDNLGNNFGLISQDFFNNIVLKNSGNPFLYVIQAPAGYGKTAFSYEIGHLLSKKHQESFEAPFPIFIPFSKYRRFGKIRDILRAEIEELKLYGVNSKALLRLVHEGHAIVILDGFDELMAEVGIKSAKENLNAIAEFIQGNARIILTSRSAFLSTNLEFSEFAENRIGQGVTKILELVPFDNSQQQQYLNNLMLSEGIISNTLHILESNKQIHSLCKSPLMLNTVASLAKEGFNGSLTLDILYDRHILALCNRERERQSYSLSNELQIKFLERLGRSMYSDNTIYYDHELLGIYWDTDASQLLLDNGYSQADIGALRTKLMCHALLDSALSVDPVKQKQGIQFIHSSFRDYFVAKYLGEVIATSGNGSKVNNLIRRPLSEELAEIISCHYNELDKWISLIIKDKECGPRNSLSILISTIRSGFIDNKKAENILSRVITSKEINGANFSGFRFEKLLFKEWKFPLCNFNDSQWVDVIFKDCDFSDSYLYSCTIFKAQLDGSNFGEAFNVNRLGVIEDAEIERLYDNKEIRLWLHNKGAKVKTDDISVLKTSAPIPTLNNELLQHTFSKFFPRGSDSEQRLRKEITFFNSLPSHQHEKEGVILEWLKKRGVLVVGAVGETLGIHPDYRNEIKSFMKKGEISSKIKKLLDETNQLRP